jgi:hypothetical protein
MREPDEYPIPKPFHTGFSCQRIFGIEKTSQLIQRLLGEPNLRLFAKSGLTPCRTQKPVFLRNFVKKTKNTLVGAHSKSDNGNMTIAEVAEQYSLSTDTLHYSATLLLALYSDSICKKPLSTDHF